MLPLVLVLALAADPSTGDDLPPLHEADASSSAEEAPRLDLALWGGELLSQRGGGPRSAAWGAEAAWRFDRLDLGLLGGAYEVRETTASGGATTSWAPLYLLRIGQRFETRNGLLASFIFGAGAARKPDWRSWFQVAIGARATWGPAFLAGELSFESDEILRLSVGVGVSVF